MNSEYWRNYSSQHIEHIMLAKGAEAESYLKPSSETYIGKVRINRNKYFGSMLIFSLRENDSQRLIEGLKQLSISGKLPFSALYSCESDHAFLLVPQNLDVATINTIKIKGTLLGSYWFLGDITPFDSGYIIEVSSIPPFFKTKKMEVYKPMFREFGFELLGMLGSVYYVSPLKGKTFNTLEEIASSQIFKKIYNDDHYEVRRIEAVRRIDYNSPDINYVSIESKDKIINGYLSVLNKYASQMKIYNTGRRYIILKGQSVDTYSINLSSIEDIVTVLAHSVLMGNRRSFQNLFLKDYYPIGVKYERSLFEGSFEEFIYRQFEVLNWLKEMPIFEISQPQDEELIEMERKVMDRKVILRIQGIDELRDYSIALAEKKDHTWRVLGIVK